MLVFFFFFKGAGVSPYGVVRCWFPEKPQRVCAHSPQRPKSGPSTRPEEWPSGASVAPAGAGDGPHRSPAARAATGREEGGNQRFSSALVWRHKVQIRKWRRTKTELHMMKAMWRTRADSGYHNSFVQITFWGYLKEHLKRAHRGPQHS